MPPSYQAKLKPVSTSTASYVAKLKPMTASAPAAGGNAMDTAAGVLDAIFGGGKVGEAIGTEIARMRATPEERKFITPGPTAGQIAGSALQSASLFLPVGRIASSFTAGARALGLVRGASAVGKIGAGALTGGAFDVAQNLQEGKTGGAALTPGIGAGIGAALPAAGVAKNVAKRFGQEQAPRVINSLIRPLAKDFSYGKNPGRAVAEAKIVANDFDELVTKIRETRQTTGQEIGALGRKLSTKPIVDISDSLMPLDEAMRAAASQNNPTLLARLANVKKAVTTIMEPAVDDAGNITIKEVGARQLKGLTFQESRDVLGQIGDITQFTGNPSDDKAVNGALKRVYGAIKGSTLEAADATDATLAAEFRKLTEKYADLSSAEVAAKYRDKILERGSLVGLSPQVFGIGTALLTFAATGGAATPAILVGVSGAVLDKLAASPAFKTRLAAALSKKSPQQLNAIYQKVPALQKLFPKGSPISPGDYLLETPGGQKAAASVKNSLKNPSLGLSIKDVSGIAPELKPLAAEAKKYKSAEEYFHVTSAESAKAIRSGGFKAFDGGLGNGIYLAKDAEGAGIQAVGGSGVTLKTSLSPGTKILKESDPLYQQIYKEAGVSSSYVTKAQRAEIARLVKSKGYDGIAYGNETVVFDPTKVSVEALPTVKITDSFGVEHNVKPKMVATASLKPAFEDWTKLSSKIKPLAEDVSKNGVNQPLIVDRATREIRDGNKRFQVAKMQGISELPVVYVNDGKLLLSDVSKIQSQLTDLWNKVNKKP